LNESKASVGLSNPRAKASRTAAAASKASTDLRPG
jgi:hypothetical protein